MNAILQMQKVGLTYHTPKNETLAVTDLSFDCYDGELLGIVGPSGCGKSSLLSILAGIDTQSSGTFQFKKENPVIGYMLQNDALFPWLTIFENAILGLKIQKKDNLENILYVRKLLKTYRLDEFSSKYPKELSGGMRQRVALIRTLALKPDILLLDEPFSALDYQSRLAVSDDVFRILKQEKKTAIMVTHDLSEAIAMSDRIIVLSKRPCVIKNVYAIALTQASNPIENRKAPEFSYYYDLLWKDLDVNV